MYNILHAPFQSLAILYTLTSLYTLHPSPPYLNPAYSIMSGKQDLSKYSYQAMSSLVVDQGEPFLLKTKSQ